MAQPGRLLSALGEPGGGGRVLAIGAPASLRRALTVAGWTVAEHALDRNPVAVARGERLVPPVTAWPVADGAYDAVVLLGEPALVVDDEAALKEAARVLRPGGTLVLAVPNAGPLAWLDAANLYRYLRDITHRGPKLAETRGVGWQRHYRRRDVRDLLAGSFRLRAWWTEGIGLAELVRLAILLLVRWALRSEHGAALERRLPAAVAGWEARLRPGTWGSTLVAVAEREDRGAGSGREEIAKRSSDKEGAMGEKPEQSAAAIGPSDDESVSGDPDERERRAREEFWQAVDEIRARNRDKDPDEEMAFITEVVEEVRRERYEREQREAEGGR